MRRLVSCGLTVLTLALLLAGPGHAAKFGQKDLIGTWNGDVMAMLQASGMMEQMPPGFDVSQLLAGFEIALTFDKDGTVTFYNKSFDGEKTEVEHYEIVSTEDNVLRLKSVDEEGTEEVVTVTFDDRDNITLTSDMEGAPPMAFSRAGKKAKKTEAKASEAK